jgi:mRNA interferase MazF
MMPFAQGEVLVLPFPYSDKLAEKKRPAVVVSKPALESAHGLVWVAMITSDRGARRADDVAISNMARAGLPAPSLVRPVKLATIEPARVLRVAGALVRADLAAVLRAIQRFI